MQAVLLKLISEKYIAESKSTGNGKYMVEPKAIMTCSPLISLLLISAFMNQSRSYSKEIKGEQVIIAFELILPHKCRD
jgi:hypothetical protein